MDKIQAKLMRERHFYDRCAGFISAQKPSLPDMRLAIQSYTRFHFSDELLLELMGDSSIGNNYRRVRQSVEYISANLDQNLLSVESSDWNKPFIPEFARQPISRSNVVVGDFA